jgi:hypothetical protein
MGMLPDKKRITEKKAKAIGALLATGFHLFLGALFVSTGMKTIYPPPEDKGLLIEFIEEEQVPVRVMASHEPRVENPDPLEEVRLVQRSQSALEGSAENTGEESTLGAEGEVEQYEPPRPIIDQRALFPSASNADSTDSQKSKEKSEELEAGHPSGNTEQGSTEGAPQARLKGRSVMGSLPEPEYKVNKSGKVVVKIKVDQYGKVIGATPGAEGTTVQDKTLWEASKKAALDAKFNLSSTAPAVQEGTITYIFRLK